MAIIICDGNMADHKRFRDGCVMPNKDWCCLWCEHSQDCEYECHYSIHAINCRNIKKEE